MNGGLRDAYRHHLAHGGYIAGQRAICAIRAARDEELLRRMIDHDLVRISVSEDDRPWDGDVPYDGTLFVLEVEILGESEYLGGIATDDDDVCSYFDWTGLQATTSMYMGGQGGQCTLQGYLRVCAVEVATESHLWEAAVRRVNDRAGLKADAIWNGTNR